MRVIERVHENEDYGNVDQFDIELVDDSGEQVNIASFNCQEDCPEDNNIERNFNDVYKIRSLIETAYQAGKEGEDLTFATEEVDW